ncbi:hypothetical protein SAMN05216289_12729 [Dokdonella immobilis]|uniref:CVNH domain-containing protein n=2 Tax=Dokdonella immobilis TaxID=578942 RepID=A0A1I4ZNI4_9GAMM|nr:hypothetical protein SAMN05216289_12729 [Dokdonella immobilis]
MNSCVQSLAALAFLAIFAAPSPSRAQPPVCPVVKCTPEEFPVRPKVYECPKLQPVGAPIEAILDCTSIRPHSVRCRAFPVEVESTCGGSGTNLIYEWSVRVGMSTYPYPPSYDNTISVSCMALEGVNVDVKVWNGGYSSNAHFGMRCGDEPN